VAHPALGDKSKIYLTSAGPLGLIKISVKATDEEREGFDYLRQTFPNVSEDKTKEGVFVGPQVTKIFEDQDSTKFNSIDRRGWKAFENVCRNFTGNKTAESYSEIVHELISSHSAVGCNMSLKLHFLQSHLDFFPGNIEAASDEHGGSFLQDISQTENSSSGKWSQNMLAD